MLEYANFSVLTLQITSSYTRICKKLLTVDHYTATLRCVSNLLLRGGVTYTKSALNYNDVSELKNWK